MKRPNHRLPPEEIERFAREWNAARDIAHAAALLGMTYWQTAARAHRLRAQGVPLKSMVAVERRIPQCKLSDYEVGTLRADVAAGMPQNEAAGKYGVTTGLVSMLVSRRTRNRLLGPAPAKGDLPRGHWTKGKRRNEPADKLIAAVAESIANPRPGRSCRAVAAWVGVDSSTVRRWISGRCNPAAEHIPRLKSWLDS